LIPELAAIDNGCSTNVLNVTGNARMNILSPGANATIGASNLLAIIRHGTVSGADIDVSAFLVTAAGKVRSDADMCFYGQTSVAGGAVVLGSVGGGEARFQVDLQRIPSGVEKIVFTATIHENRAQFSRVPEISLDFGTVQGRIPCTGMTETALILAEIYPRNGIWKVRVVGQGFNGGLAALARHLGVEIAESAPTPAPSTPPPNQTVQPPGPPPAPPVNLNKVTLTKNSSTISLKKDDGRFGKIRINLNWNRSKKTGFFGLGSSAVDLDLGAFVETRDGQRHVIQALGKAFGRYQHAPYVQLLGDDRTGASVEGEWLEINGDYWGEIRRVIIYAFIYDGAANWQKTDGVVRILVPGQPEIEVRMNEYGDNRGSCVVALIENHNGQVKVSREVTFHQSQRFIDQHYGWGFQWSQGSK
jgi:tellurite resistance protein TerA